MQLILEPATYRLVRMEHIGKFLTQYDNDIMFDQGIWLIGKRNNDTIAAGSQWFRNYSPGPMINGEAAMLIHPEDSLRYRVYKISKNDDASNPDYAEWPIDFGAPINNLGKSANLW